MIPAHQSLGACDIPSIQIIARLKIEDEFAVLEALQNLWHQYLLVAVALASHGSAAVRNGIRISLGQALQQVCNLFDFLAFPIAHLLFNRGDHIFMERINEHAQIMHHRVPGDAVNDIENQ